MCQSTNTVIMVRPISFAMNEQTIVNNYFQQKNEDGNTLSHALMEFDRMVEILKFHGVDVLIVENDHPAETPDAVFPNNWFSLHDGVLVLYPMFAPNRRLERIAGFGQKLGQMGIKVSQVLDLSSHEEHEKYLEGTGSLVLDRLNRRAFAALSDRTHIDLVRIWAEKMKYEPIIFHAFQDPDNQEKPIYHTNV
ncbi:MAG: arginine deiminase-related protein, partial [Flavobacteriales bacterium]